MKKYTLKKILLGSIVMSNLLLAGANDIEFFRMVKEDAIQHRTINVVNTIKKEKEVFFEMGLGLNHLSITDDTNKQNTFISEDAFDSSAAVLDFSLGYYITENISTKINFQKAKYDINTITSTNFIVDYQFNDLFLSPFVGGIIGYSDLEWERAPISNAVNSIKTSQSFVLGLEAGIEVEIAKGFSVTAKTQFLKFNHETFIKHNLFEHTLQTNFIIGVKYEIF